MTSEEPVKSAVSRMSFFFATDSLPPLQKAIRVESNTVSCTLLTSCAALFSLLYVSKAASFDLPEIVISGKKLCGDVSGATHKAFYASICGKGGKISIL